MRAEHLFESETAYGSSATQQKTRWYQAILKVAGRYAAVTINGNHNDAETRKALRRFQQFFKLRETGYLEVDSNVALAQLALEWIYRTSLPNVKGTLGQPLKELISRFQRDYGLAVDGQVGPLTREKMVEVLNQEIPSPLRRYHRTLGFVSPPSSPSSHDECQVISLGGCSHLVDDSGNPGDLSGLMGDDSRIEVNTSRILKIPWRWTCLVDATHDNHDHHPDVDRDDERHISLKGTGVLIGTQHVLTAAHLLFDEIDGSRGTRRFSRAREINVVPACMGLVNSSTRVAFSTIPFGGKKLVTPFGVHRAIGDPLFRAPTGWLAYLHPGSDYAIIRLKEPIGSLRVPGSTDECLGWWGSSEYRGSGASIVPVSKYALLQQTVCNIGYPHCSPNRRIVPYRQYRGFGRVADVELSYEKEAVPEWIGHDVDTPLGHSGGPIWTFDFISGVFNLVAIQTSTGKFVDPEGCLNLGIHLSPNVWERIEAWMR